jgi:nucleoside-diphosphate-sugar epimerase
MIIGNGLVAKAFQFYGQNREILIYAAGVSDSKSSTDNDFLREKELLASSIHNNPDYRVVYFSTTSVNDPDLQETPYVQHKVKMEGLIRQQAARYHIFRLPNLAGHSANPNTILNFLVDHIRREQPFELWKYSERNLIDVADVFRIGQYILENNLFPNRIVNIANEQNYPVKEIVRSIESHTGKKAVYTEKDKGSSFRIGISDILPICRSLGIRFEENYLRNLLETYYPTT